ncbi:MAG: bifunctional diaminohydroxyphosphoribosylaminopyrimidine deaminase/5-amino-6-(5-phosphoribosylamino)uracil reductase RibD [Actinomycetes bacterium]
MTTDPQRDPGSAEALMARARDLAASVRRSTAPNPWVGAVLVADGVVVGEGATRPPGGPHAEVVALAEAGERARGATMVVTLEPCAHRGRTGPCADALVAAGVARVIVGVEDPDQQVAGAGIARLRAAGIEVEVGPGGDEVRAQLAPYLHHRRTGRSFCLAKSALSLDGRVAAADGTSRWITGPRARADAHGVRADSQAVVVGSGTALADRPALTVRDVAPAPERPPLRVLLDGLGRVSADGPLFDVSLAPTLVCTTRAAPDAVVAAWRAAGAEVEVVAPSATSPRRGVDLGAMLDLLGARGVLQAMVEGGSALHGALVAEGRVDRLVCYVGAVSLGADGLPGLAWPGPSTIADAPRWTLESATVLGDDVRLDYTPRPADAAPTGAD